MCITTHRWIPWLFTAALAAFGQVIATVPAAAQEPVPSNNSYLPRVTYPGGRPITFQDTIGYVAPPPPKVLRQYDLITIRVDEVTRVRSSGEVERRKTGLYDAQLKDWVYLIGLKAIKPSPQVDGDPRVQGNLNSLYRAEGELETNESLAFNITAQIVEIRPNQTMLLEARKHIRVNNEVWEMSLTGVCREEDIGPDNVVLSRDLAQLRVEKKERGVVRDAYRRGWFLKFFDTFIQPF